MCGELGVDNVIEVENWARAVSAAGDCYISGFSVTLQETVAQCTTKM